MLSKLDILVSHPKWISNIGTGRVYIGMADFIMEILGTGDKRTIAFWIGKETRRWIPDKKNQWFSSRSNRWVVPKKAVYEWKDGFLQRHGYVETIEDPEAEKNRKEGVNLRMFRILKGSNR